MKRLVLFLSIVLCFCVNVNAQKAVAKLRYDTVQVGGPKSGATVYDGILQIFNGTQNVQNGLLVNTGNGITKFVKTLTKINDSTWLVGYDTLKMKAAGANFTAAPPIFYTGGVVSMAQATSIVDGYLAHTDFATFANKQNAITWQNVTAASTRITLGGGNGVAAVFAGFSIDVNEGALNLANMGGTLPITKGGTGGTTRAGALNNLLPAQSSGVAGYVLSTDGSGNVTWQPGGGGGGGGSQTLDNVLALGGGFSGNHTSSLSGFKWSFDSAALYYVKQPAFVNGVDTFGIIDLKMLRDTAAVLRGLIPTDAHIAAVAPVQSVNGATGVVTIDGTIVHIINSATVTYTGNGTAGTPFQFTAVGGGGSSTLAGLTDVNISSPANNQILIYSSGTSKWVNGSLTTTNVAEGTNLYFTNARFDTRFRTDILPYMTTDSIAEGTNNLYFTNARARLAISVAGLPLTYNNSTGVLGINVATTTQDGYLSHTDWNTFNGKFNQPSGSTSQYIRGDGSLATTDTTMIPNFYLKVRSEFSAGTSISITNGVIAFTGTIPAQFNPVQGYGILTSGTYPNITFKVDTTIIGYPRFVRVNRPGGTDSVYYTIANSGSSFTSTLGFIDSVRVSAKGAASAYTLTFQTGPSSIYTRKIINGTGINFSVASDSTLTISNSLTSVINSLQVVNAGNVASWQAGTFGSRPSAPASGGALYYASDSNKIYFGNVNVWTPILGNVNIPVDTIHITHLATTNLIYTNSAGTIIFDKGLRNSSGIIFTTATDSTISGNLATTGVTAGTYTNATIVVGADGRISSASSGSGSGQTYTFTQSLINNSNTVTLLNDSSAGVFYLYGSNSVSRKGWYPFTSYPVVTYTTNGLMLASDKKRLDSTVHVANSPAGNIYDSIFYATDLLHLNAKRFNISPGTDILIDKTGGSQILNSYVFNADTAAGSQKLATQGYVLRTFANVIVQGTLNRISTSTVGATTSVDIASTYVGQNSITTLGTIVNGVWQGTAVGVGFGGTGNSSLTAYAVLAGGTTSTGSLQQISNAGAVANYVLTYTGANSLPTWQPSQGSGGIGTITGDLSASGSGTVVGTLATVNAGVFTSQTPLKITVNAKGLITSAAAITAGDITTILGFTPLATNQTITLSGDVTGSGSTAITATIGANKVTYAKIQQVNPTRILGNGTSTVGNVQEIGITGGLVISGANLTLQGVPNSALANSSITINTTDFTGNGTYALGGTVTLNVQAGAITYNKIQNETAQTLLGRFTNSNGTVQEITVGTGLALNSSTGVLSSTGVNGNIYVTDGDITANRLIGGSNNTFGITFGNGGDLLTSFNVDAGNITLATVGGIITMSGPVRYGVSTASDLNYISNTDYYIILPTISANRTITLPTPATGNTGQTIIIHNKNSSGSFNWSFASAIQDDAGNNYTTLSNTTTYTLFCDGTHWIVNSPVLPTIQNGTYTPTLTGVGNISGVPTANNAFWQRTGNVVDVTGTFTYNPISTSQVVINVSLPINSNITATSFNDCTGTVGAEMPASGATMYVGVIAGQAANTAQMTISPSPGTNTGTAVYHFKYVIK